MSTINAVLFENM